MPGWNLAEQLGVCQLRKVGSAPEVAWMKVTENMSKPGAGSHSWFWVMGKEVDGERELSADRQAERNLGGPSST